MLFRQCTQVSRQLHCFNSKALDDFSAPSGILSSVQPCTCSSWQMLAGTLLLASGARWAEVAMKHIRAEPGFQRENFSLEPSAKEGKAAFLLHQYFTSFKYCDNWSALVVTIQVQEPGLASVMNTVCLPPLFPVRFHQPSSKNKNNLMKIGKWAPDIKLFFSDWSSFHCSVNSLDLGLV